MNTRKEKIQSITGEVTFYGNGVINNDSNEQKFILRNLGLIEGRLEDNVMFHKKNFFTENGENRFNYKVSHDCIRHGIFADTMPYYNATIQNNKRPFYNAITSPSLIARGYMFADEGLKKKGTFYISDAIATDSQTKVSIETKSRAGERSNTSLFYAENVGEHIYKSSIGIDFNELQFMSLDDIYDRCAANLMNKEDEELFFKSLKRNFELTEDITKKPYYLKTSIMGEESAEEGVLLTQDMVNKVAHIILENIIRLRIQRPSLGGEFYFKGMTLDINYSDGTTEQISVNNINDIKDLFFGYEQVYLEADDELIRKREEEIKRRKEENKKNKKNTQNSDKE